MLTINIINNIKNFFMLFHLHKEAINFVYEQVTIPPWLLGYPL